MHECVFYGRSSVKAQSESAKRNDTQGRGVGAASFSYEIVFLSGCFEAREARRASEGLAPRAGLGGSPTSLSYTKLHLPRQGAKRTLTGARAREDGAKQEGSPRDWSLGQARAAAQRPCRIRSSTFPVRERSEP